MSATSFVRDVAVWCLPDIICLANHLFLAAEKMRPRPRGLKDSLLVIPFLIVLTVRIDTPVRFATSFALSPWFSKSLTLDLTLSLTCFILVLLITKNYFSQNEPFRFLCSLNSMFG